MLIQGWLISMKFKTKRFIKKKESILSFPNEEEAESMPEFHKHFHHTIQSHLTYNVSK